MLYIYGNLSTYLPANAVLNSAFVWHFVPGAMYTGSPGMPSEKCSWQQNYLIVNLILIILCEMSCAIARP